MNLAQHVPVASQPVHLYRVPGSVLIVDNVICRGSLVRELCAAMHSQAVHLTDPRQACDMVAHGNAAAVVIDFDRFGRSVLAAIAGIAGSGCATPILLVAEATLDASRRVYQLGLTQVTVIPRPLTTEALRTFLVENGCLGLRESARAVA